MSWQGIPVDALLVWVFLAALFVTIASVFRYFIKKRNTLLDFELHLKPLYSENCGARFGALNLTIPLVRLAVYHDFLVLGCLKPVIISFDDIDNVEFKRQVFFKGIDIHHHNKEIPSKIVIWSRNAKKVTEMIKSRLHSPV